METAEPTDRIKVAYRSGGLRVDALDQATLKALVHYDPDTGVMTRRVATARAVRVGDTMGSVQRNPSGNLYLRCSLGGKYYLVHRLAVLYMTGEWPRSEVDHHDGDGLNNRWPNLREADRAQNQWNAASRNRSLPKGVSLAMQRDPHAPRRYRARIGFRGKTIALGVYETVEAAHNAYVEASVRLHGEFHRAL